MGGRGCIDCSRTAGRFIVVSSSLSSKGSARLGGVMLDCGETPVFGAAAPVGTGPGVAAHSGWAAGSVTDGTGGLITPGSVCCADGEASTFPNWASADESVGSC